MFVHNLILKTGLFMLGCLCKTLSRHLLIRLFNYACSLIQTLQILTLDSEPICLSSGFERLFLNELSVRTQILCVKSFKVRYYLALKAKEYCMLERQIGKI